MSGSRTEAAKLEALKPCLFCGGEAVQWVDMAAYDSGLVADN